ncbi:MAG TPA: glycosyltransferase family 4 protein [Longimicrobiales bacterium]|nr:glycosyltransferase family 4 protein [Longimicrobiales bacterium]
MIRVCVVAPAYMTGGQAIEAKTMLRGFADDPDVRLELQPIDPRIPAWLGRIRGVRTVARMPLYWAGLFRRISRADVVHVFTAAFWPFLLTTTPAVLLGRLMGRPVIINYRDGRAADHIRHAWVRWVLERASVLVFPSGFLQDVFRRFGLHGEVISNVVDTERFRFRRRDPLQPVLLSCRLLEELYAVDNTIRAFALVRAQVPEARLVIIGDGDQRASLEQLVGELELSGVEFHGAVPHAEVPEWFDRTDVLVNSSVEDNMPHSLIEAFAAGLPVVTTGAGGIPYVVEDGRNGICVPMNEPETMARAVLDLLDVPAKAAALIDAAREDCEARYSWMAARDEWVALYGRVLSLDVPVGRELTASATELV